MAETNNKPQVTAEAPPEVTMKLKEFGVEWTGNAIKIPGTTAKLELDENTKSVEFDAGRSNVEIVVHNKVGPDNVMLISKGSIKIDGEEFKLPFVDRNGSKKLLTLGEIQAKVYLQSIDDAEAAGQLDKPTELIQDLLDLYGPKSWVSHETMFKKLLANEIAVSRPVRGEDPIFAYRGGMYYPVNYRDSYQPMDQHAFLDFIEKGPHRND